MAEPFLPYEISLMVLRYLYSQNCRSTAVSFMNEMPCLANACKNPEKLYLPAVFGGLNDILNDYGRTKLLVKDLVMKLADWEAMADDAVSPCDTLITQLRYIGQLMSSIFSPSAKHNKPNWRQHKKLCTSEASTSASVQTSDASVGCTTMDVELNECGHGSKQVMKQMVEIGTQTNFLITEDDLVYKSIVQASEVQKDKEPMQIPNTEISRPVIEDISEEEDATGNEVKVVDETGNESEPEINSTQQAAKLFYDVLLEDESGLQNIVSLANQQLTFNQQTQQLAGSPVKEDQDTILVDQTVSSGALTEVDRFLQQLLSNDPALDPDLADMEEGEIVDDSQEGKGPDSIGELKAAEKSIASHFEGKQGSKPISTFATPVPEPSLAKVHTNLPVDGETQAGMKNEERRISLLSAVVQNQPHKFRTVRPILPKEKPCQENQVRSENGQNIKTTNTNRVKSTNSQKVPLRRRSDWQKIGRRSITPKIPARQSGTTHCSALMAPAPVIAPSVTVTPKPEKPEINIDVEKLAQVKIVAPLPCMPVNQPSLSESKSRLFPHLLAATQRTEKKYDHDFCGVPTPKTNKLPKMEPQNKSFSTPRKKHVRNLQQQFSTPQNRKHIRQEKADAQQNRSENSSLAQIKLIIPQDSKGKARKALFQSDLPKSSEESGQAEIIPVRRDSTTTSAQPDRSKPSKTKPRDNQNDLTARKRKSHNLEKNADSRNTTPSPPKKIRSSAINNMNSSSTNSVPIIRGLTPQLRKPDDSDTQSKTNEEQSHKRVSNSATSANQKLKIVPIRIGPVSKQPTISPPFSTGPSHSDQPVPKLLSESRRKRKEPQKLKSSTATATPSSEKSESTSVTPSSTTSTDIVSSSHDPQTLPSSCCNNDDIESNFIAPRTPQYKGAIDSDWESQSSENFGAIGAAFLQRFPSLLTPIRDNSNDLPDTPGKNLHLHKGDNDNVSNESVQQQQSIFASLNAAIRRGFEKRNDDKLNANITVSQPNEPPKAVYIRACQFPQGLGQLVTGRPTVSADAQKNSERNLAEDGGEPHKVNPSQNVQPEVKASMDVAKQQVNQPVSLNKTKRTHDAHEPEPTTEDRSGNYIVKFAVGGKSKMLTHLERATAISLCQLSQVGSPGPRLQMTPPPCEVEDTAISSTGTDGNGIEDLLVMLHGRRQ